VRRLAAAAIVASLLGAAPARLLAETPAEIASEPEPAPPAPTAAAVFLPRAPAALRAVDGGVRIWIVQELRRDGVPVVAPSHTDAVAAKHLAPDHLFLQGADTKALARETEARAVLLTQLTQQGGELELWIRAYDPAGEILAVGHASGRMAALGEALVKALEPVRQALGASAAPREAPPRLSELGSYERALDRLAANELAAAWREVDEIRTPTADALREDIVAKSSAPGFAGPERSRLASVRGTSDPDWLTVRQTLQRERGVAVLLAGAEHAVAAGDAKGALVLFAEAAKVDSRSLDAERGRANALVALERYDDAKAAFERVLAMAPEDVGARVALAGNPTLPPAEQARWWVAAGELQSRKLDDEGARSSFEQAAALDATLHGVTRRYVARLEETLGNDPEAGAAYDEAAAADASDLEALAGLGRVRSRTGDPTGASAAFEQVLAKQPDHPAALAGLGDVLLAEGKAEQAVPRLERALALAPRDAGRRTSLARAFAAAGKADAALSVLDPAQVDRDDRAQILTQSAELHAAAGRLGEAQAALEQAVAIEPDEPPLRTALAKVYADAGKASEAKQQQALVSALSGAKEIATTDGLAGAAGTQTAPGAGGDEFAGLAASFPTVTAERQPIGRVVWLGLEPVQGWQARVRAWLLPRTLDAHALESALRAAFAGRYQLDALHAIPEPATHSLANVRAFGTERADISLVNDVLDTEALLVARFTTVEPERLLDPPGGALAVEVRLATGRQSDAVWMVGNAATLPDPSRYYGWNYRAAGVLAVFLALLMLPLVRGWGGIVVVLDYDKSRGSQGFFSIELSRLPGRTKQERKGSGRSRAAKYQRRARPWARYTRHMVGRETRMGWLPARQWYVAVHGLLQDITTHDVIGNYLEERKVRVKRGDTVQVVFDFRRKAAPIEVQLYLEDSAAVPQARVSVLGIRDSLRFVKDASTTVFLPQGKYTILIGFEDRVYERAVEVREMVGQTVGVQVDRTDTAVFTGCKDAVEPYLLGDLAAASRTLERSGKAEAAALIRAAHHRMRGEAEEGARWLEKAGRFQEAAELSKQAPEPKRSADLFEKAGDFRNAAEEHARAGDALQAARAYEAAFEYGAAIDAYRNAGEKQKALELLEKTGRFFEAGTIALETGEDDRALRCFQQVGARESEYADACDALSKLFADRRAFDLAVDKARESLEARGGDEAPLEAQEGLANLLERAGRSEEALAVWENIRKRDFQYAGASDRVESLRESVAETQRATAALAAATSSPAVTAPARESRYEILGEIGRGGMGVVWKARDKRLGRVVALKRMPENLKSNPTAVQLFLREARAAAALSHPNIVTLFDADQEADGSYYLTMELLEGFGLDSVLQKRGKLTPRDAVRIGIQIAKGLQFAHEKGVVHRDIKTANLFFTRERVLKIMDFGLAKMSEEVRKAATVIGGTPYYMAPEQAVGGDVDHRADLYALGVTLFELVTGSVPFQDGDVTHHHRHTPAPDPRSLDAEIPEALAKLILRLMEKTPEMRPATTAEVVRALEQLLGQLGGNALSSAGSPG